jgi:hypothetical protein
VLAVLNEEFALAQGARYYQVRTMVAGSILEDEHIDSNAADVLNFYVDLQTLPPTPVSLVP